MPDATDRPVNANPEAAEPILRLGPTAPPAPEETYRPLSMLAVAGFGLAVLYAVIVVGGGLISFFIRAPWLLSFWAVLLPLIAFAVSWVALQRIRDSEGTLGGESLAKTGVGLSVVFGLTYASYYTATRFAKIQQATSFVENVW